MTSAREPGRSFVLGTRGSALALRQAHIVRDALLQARPEFQIEISVIRTHGDEPASGSPANAQDAEPATERPPFDPASFIPSGEGIFVRSIETALKAGRIDLAVHSFKDMPSVGPPELTIGAFPVREDPRDVLVARDGLTLQTLPSGSAVGTGSPRRRALLLDARSDIRVEPVRGNVDTRLRSVGGSDLAAVVLAGAGLKRLERESEITEWLDPRVFVPAIGQGTLAVQVRTEDEAALDLVRSIDDAESRLCALAERALALKVLADCATPVAAYAQLDGDQIAINAFILAHDGTTLVRAQLRGPSSRAEAIGTQVAELLLAGQDALG